MKSKFPLKWTTGLSREESEALLSELERCSLVRKRFIYLLDRELNSTVATQISKNSYDSPNWSFKQADAIGFHRAIVEMTNLFKEIEEK